MSGITFALLSIGALYKSTLDTDEDVQRGGRAISAIFAFLACGYAGFHVWQ